MSNNEDTFYRVSADFENIEDAKRFKLQIENMQNDDESDSRFASLARISDANFPQDVARVLRGSGISLIDMISACVYVQRCTEVRVADLERLIADLRSSHQPADPTGAHPYRSSAQCLAVAASSPVATSEAAPTSSSASGAWRRVYGALRGRGFESGMLVLLWGIGIAYFYANAWEPAAAHVVMGLVPLAVLVETAWIAQRSPS